MTRLLLTLMAGAHRLPPGLLRAIGGLLGTVLYFLARERRQVAQTNIKACLPALNSAQRRALVRRTFRLFGQGLVDRAILWHASANCIRRFVRLEGASHLSALAGRPVILLAPHFVGLDAAWSRLTLQQRLVTIYANQKDPAFNAALLAGRRRFNDPLLLSRQDGVREALRALKEGLPLYYLPDMDLGARDALFVPFFGVPAATVTAVARLARLSGAAIVPCIATLSDRGYHVRLYPPWQDYPGVSVESDTRRMNAFIEEMVRAEPAQYHWLHKRFKTRPRGAPAFYGKP